MPVANRNLTERVEVLEMKVGMLEELPARMAAVEAQIVQLRTEMRDGFSAVRQETRELGGALRSQMQEQEGRLRQEMRALNEETRAEVRMLHEEVIDRISRIGEGGRPARKRKG
jgi:hypothetical protein